MPLSLRESRAVRNLAEALYGFLPGSGNPAWKGHISFKTVAGKVGVGDFWQEGSKQPAIAALLERTLEQRRTRFEPLVLEIVRAGLTYREKSGKPVTSREITTINGLILEIGFKFPALWDRDFLTSLQSGGATRAKEHFEQAQGEDKTREIALSERNSELAALRSEFIGLHSEPDRQRVGFALEKLLTRLFELNGLAPREPFRVVGEQIDGSFELDNEVYLLEVKWHKERSPAADLYVFREKVEGKSRFTRGVFLSINGISSDAEIAITQGKQPLFFTITGHDLLMCLGSTVPLPLFLRRRQRLLAERGLVAVPFHDCGL